jgi:predicted nucleotidyltransferase
MATNNVAMPPITAGIPGGVGVEYSTVNLEPRHIEQLCRELDIRLMVLFGSRAGGGGARPGSDTDLAVLFAIAPDDLRLQGELENILRRRLEIQGRLDLVILNTLGSTTLGREIARGGKVLYDSDGDQWPLFVTKAIKAYADFKPFRRLREKSLRGEPIP